MSQRGVLMVNMVLTLSVFYLFDCGVMDMTATSLPETHWTG